MTPENVAALACTCWQGTSRPEDHANGCVFHAVLEAARDLVAKRTKGVCEGGGVSPEGVGTPLEIAGGYGGRRRSGRDSSERNEMKKKTRERVDRSVLRLVMAMKLALDELEASGEAVEMTYIVEVIGRIANGLDVGEGALVRWLEAKSWFS